MPTYRLKLVNLRRIVTFVHAEVLPKVIVTTEVLLASWEWALMRFFICVDAANMPFQVFTPGETLSATNRITSVGSSILAVHFKPLSLAVPFATFWRGRE